MTTHHPKRWGRVAARPSEYLIKIRKGKVVRHGPGLSVFLWPGDTCTVIPTSIQRATFTADQITSEKVGVAVTGIAVYRVADPLLAFRMLDFSEGDRSMEELAAIMRDMFIGAARRLVANMTVAECLTRRKESIAQELMREIQPVVSGQGRTDDATDQGWGIVIDTIEIQDVRILSEKVFADMQAPFRAGLELASRKSQVERDQEVHLREVEAERRMLEVDLDLARRRSEAGEEAKRDELARTERLRMAQIEGQSRTAQAQLASDLDARARTRTLAEAEHALALSQEDQRAAAERQRTAHAAALEREQAEHAAALERSKLEARVALEEREAEAAGRVAELRGAVERLQGAVRAELARQAREVENLLPEERLRYDFVVTTLPAIARAFAESLGPVHLTQIASGDGEGRGLGFLAETFAQVLAVGRSAGLDLSGLCQRPAKPE
jgi:hypothetical protein